MSHLNKDYLLTYKPLHRFQPNFAQRWRSASAYCELRTRDEVCCLRFPCFTYESGMNVSRYANLSLPLSNAQISSCQRRFRISFVVWITLKAAMLPYALHGSFNFSLKTSQNMSKVPSSAFTYASSHFATGQPRYPLHCFVIQLTLNSNLILLNHKWLKATYKLLYYIPTVRCRK